MRAPEPITAADIQKKFTPLCGRCGSDDVRIEVFAEWNDIKQTWAIRELLDANTVCAHCGRDTEFKWRLEK
jgi:hypothetical protein